MPHVTRSQQSPVSAFGHGLTQCSIVAKACGYARRLTTDYWAALSSAPHRHISGTVAGSFSEPNCGIELISRERQSDRLRRTGLNGDRDGEDDSDDGRRCRRAGSNPAGEPMMSTAIWTMVGVSSGHGVRGEPSSAGLLDVVQSVWPARTGVGRRPRSAPSSPTSSPTHGSELRHHLETPYGGP